MGMSFLSHLIPLLILALPRKHGIRKIERRRGRRRSLEDAAGSGGRVSIEDVAHPSFNIKK